MGLERCCRLDCFQREVGLLALGLVQNVDPGSFFQFKLVRIPRFARTNQPLPFRRTRNVLNVGSVAVGEAEVLHQVLHVATWTFDVEACSRHRFLIPCKRNRFPGVPVSPLFQSCRSSQNYIGRPIQVRKPPCLLVKHALDRLEMAPRVGYQSNLKNAEGPLDGFFLRDLPPLELAAEEGSHCSPVAVC